MRLRDHGFSLVESMAVSGVMALLVTFLMASFYLYYSDLMLNHVGYRGLICISSGQPKKLCKQAVLKKLKLFLPIGKLGSYRASRWRGRFQLRIKWTVFGSEQVKFDRKLKSHDGY